MTEQEFPIWVYPESFTKKPSEIEYSSISSYFKTDNNFQDINVYCVNEIVDIIESGKTFRPTVSYSNRNEGFIQTNLLAFDFDSGISLESIMTRLKNDGLSPIISYYSFSHKPDFQKFRVLFGVENITSENQFNHFYNLFGQYFGKSSTKKTIKKGDQVKGDRVYTSINNYYPLQKTKESGIEYYEKEDWIFDISCKNPSRMYNGSFAGSVFYKNENAEPIQYEYLYSIVNHNEVEKDKNNNVSKTFHKKFSDYSIEDHNKVNRVEYSEEILNILQKPRIEDLKKHCKLYKDLTERELHNQEYFHLACNMIHFNEKIVKTFIENAEKFDKKNWKNNVKHLKNNNYNATACKKYCAYHQECQCGTIVNRMLSEFTKKELPMTDFNSYSENLKTDLYKALQAKDSKIHLIKYKTGAGKTHHLINYINDGMEESITVCEPTHHKKAEVANDIQVSKVETLELSKETPNYGLITHYMQCGLLDEAEKLLSESEEGQHYLAHYKKNMRGVVLTTHHKVIFSNNENDVLVFDEDLFGSCLFQIIEISDESVNSFKAFIEQNSESKIYDKFIKRIADIKASENSVKNHKKISLDGAGSIYKKYLKESKNTDFSNVLALFKAGMMIFKDNSFYVLIDNTQVIEKCLAKGQTVIVMSATLNEDFYKAKFGVENVIVYEPKEDVSPKATIIYHSDLSFSKSSIFQQKSRYAPFETDINNMDCPVITYSKSKNQFSFNRNNKSLMDNIHFGNCQGYNQLKDVEKMVVYGKLVLPLVAIQLYKAAIYNDFSFDSSKNSINVKYNGRYGERMYFTFWSEPERTIDLWYSGTQIEQAMGRCRPLTNTCELQIYNDFPRIF